MSEAPTTPILNGCITPTYRLDHQPATVGLRGRRRPFLGLEARLAPVDAVHDLEVGELVVRRKLRGGVRGALGLGDLHQRLVQRPLLGVGLVDRLAVRHVPVEVVTVAEVAVVRDGQHVDALGGLTALQVLPEVFGVVQEHERR